MIDWDIINEYRPDRWPGDGVIEPENMGDWGAWLWRYDGPLQDVFLDEEADAPLLPGLAEMMAEDYLSECDETGIPLPSDFADSEAERNQLDQAYSREAVASFISFIKTWRLRWIEAGRPGLERNVD